MQRYIYTLIILFLFSSCKKEKQYVYEYYETGNLKLKVELVDSVANGDWIYYYPNGQIKEHSFCKDGKFEDSTKMYDEGGNLRAILPMNNGEKHGMVREFFPNGNIARYEKYINGLRVGISKIYYENDSGKLHWEEYYSAIQAQNRDRYMRGVEYDKSGKIIKDDKVVDLRAYSDTLDLGEMTHLTVKNTKPVYDSIDVILGNFDELFNLPENSKLDTLRGENGIVKIRIAYNEQGKHRFRLLVRDYKIDHVNGTTITTTALHNYVYYDFYVR